MRRRILGSHVRWAQLPPESVIRTYLCENLRAHRDVSDAHSVVDQGFPFPGRIPTVHIGSAGFQLQRRGDAITRLKLIIARLLSVFMQVDKPRRHYKALRIDRLLAFQCLTRNRPNLASTDSYI